MLSKIFRKKNIEADASRYTEDLVLDLNQSDREEDGFLLVGESLYERNIIYARKFQHSQSCIDCPPAYETLCKTVNMGNSQVVKQASTPVQNGNGSVDKDCKLLDLTHTSQSDSVTEIPDVTAHMISLNVAPSFTEAEVVKHAYEDIPFQLSPVLRGICAVSQMQQESAEMCRSINQTNLTRYEYEFSLEKSVLQGLS